MIEFKELGCFQIATIQCGTEARRWVGRSEAIFYRLQARMRRPSEKATSIF